MNQDQEFDILKEIFGLNGENKRVNKSESDGMSDKDKLAKKEKKELLLPKVLRTEFNFLKYPFFDLSTTSKRDILEIRENIQSQDGKADIFWKVSRPLENSFPGAFDKKLHRAIEHIVNRLPRPVSNPIRLGSLRDLCQLMNINKSGKNINAIKSSLERMVTTDIKARGTFYLKNSKKFVDDVFHLYERVVWTGEELPDGKSADAVYLMLGSFYLQNINANYVVPLDWEYYSSLQTNIASRMYEFLGLSFYAALEKNQPFVQIKYSRLCDYLPLTRQTKRMRATDQLSEAHKVLTETKYFARKPKWVNSEEPDDWVIRYWIGERAKNEWQDKKQYRRAEIAEGEPYSLIELSVEEPPKEVEQHELVTEMIKRGVTAYTAKRLFSKYPDRIQQQLNHFNFLQKQHPERLGKNPAGFLRKSIEDNYSPPVDYVSPEQQEQQAKRKAEQQRQREWEDKQAAWQKWLETSPSQKVYGDLMIWQTRFKRENNRLPTIEETKEKEQELIKALPSNEEMQIKIFGEVKYKNSNLDLFEDNKQP